MKWPFRKSKPPACAHEDNIDGTTHSTPVGMVRLVCKQCGYGRIERREE